MSQSNKFLSVAGAVCFAAMIVLMGGCHSHKPANPTAKNLKPMMPPTDDEIVVCGQRFHTGAPVVLWFDSGGHDFHYSTTNPSAPDARKPYNIRRSVLTRDERDRVENQGWTLDLLRDKIDQFVIHYDVAGVSRTCFKVLNDRHLAVQFMLDIDGTIYQTMDLEEQAAHATKANGRSVGIEIANMGAYSGSIVPLMAWYKKDADGNVRIALPARIGDGGVRTQNFIGQPARNELIRGNVQGELYRQYDYTPQQYDSLTKLTAALCTVFPKITCDYPRQKPSAGAPTTQMVRNDEGNASTQPSAIAAPWEPGTLIPHALTRDQYDSYQGVLGHYHVQLDKQDPGPAFQWDRVIDGARKLMTPEALMANGAGRDHAIYLTDSGRGRGFRRTPSTVPATGLATRPARRAGRAAAE